MSIGLHKPFRKARIWTEPGAALAPRYCEKCGEQVIVFGHSYTEECNHCPKCGHDKIRLK